MPDRNIAPPVHPITFPEIVRPDIQVFNGVSVTSIHQGDQPVLQFEMELPLGRYNEPIPGLAYYLGKMLMEGTSTKTASEIAEFFDFYGSHLEITPTLDSINIRLFTLKRFFPQMIALIEELLVDATFPEKSFKTLQSIRIQQIQQQLAKNNAFAGIQFRSVLFGHDHPYGKIIGVEQASVITLDDLKKHRQSLLQTPEIYLAGSIEERELKLVGDMISRIGFIDSVPFSPKIPQPEPSALFERSGSTQASLRMGKSTMTRQHPDYHYFKITNELFGGFFGSRLMKNIREEKGLSYGIHSAMVHLDHASYWYISTEVLKEQLDLAKKEIMKEIQVLSTVAPSKNELDTVCNYMRGKFLGAFDTPFSSLQSIKQIRKAGLEEDYFLDFQKALKTISPDHVKAMAQKHLIIDKMLSVTVA